MSDETLKPCPFCGSSASVEPRRDAYIVRCDARFLPNATGKLCPINGRTRGNATREEAIAQWNTRVAT